VQETIAIPNTRENITGTVILLNFILIFFD
jgi:hypothetical protein